MPFDIEELLSKTKPVTTEMEFQGATFKFGALGIEAARYMKSLVDDGKDREDWTDEKWRDYVHSMVGAISESIQGWENLTVERFEKIGNQETPYEKEEVIPFSKKSAPELIKVLCRNPLFAVSAEQKIVEATNKIELQKKI